MMGKNSFQWEAIVAKYSNVKIYIYIYLIMSPYVSCGVLQVSGGYSSPI